VASRSKTIAVTVVFWEDVMLAVLDAFEQSFVGVLCKLGRSRVTAAVQAEPNASTDEEKYFTMLWKAPDMQFTCDRSTGYSRSFDCNVTRHARLSVNSK